MNTKTARQQYQETYSRLRKNNNISLTTEELRCKNGKAALAASKSMFAKRHNHDKIESFQLRLTNAKERARIRKQNAAIMGTSVKIQF